MDKHRVLSSGQPTVLMVFPYCLDRLGHGNGCRILAMAQYLSRHGVALDLVYQGNPKVPSRENEFTDFRRIIRVASWKSIEDSMIFSEWKLFYNGYEPPSSMPGTALTAVVREMLDALDYTAVISSYAWTAPIFDGLSHRTLRIVDLHDVLSLHCTRSEKTTNQMAPFSMPEETEQFLWKNWDVLLAITHNEAEIIAPCVDPSQKLMIVPHGVTVVNPGESESDTVVYTGSDNASNQAAIAWLLGEVWPLVASVRPHSKLRLVGHICNVIQKTPLVAAPNVELVGYVDRPIDELAKATIVVAPYLYGSGLKIKVIEAAAAGRAIVTTTSGAEGTGFEHETHVLIENDAASFARSVIRLLDDPALRTRLAAAAQEHVKSDYSYDVCYGALFDLLRQQATDDSRKIASAHKIASASVVIPPSVKIRIHTVIEALNSPQIVVWGNGSHTRALIPVLEQLGASIRCIVDNTVSVEDVSPENYPIIPGCTFIPTPNDMLILSSQTYERRMWNDLVNLRIAGTPVLSLYCLDFTSETIRCLLKGKDNNLFPLKQTVDKYYTNSFSYIVDNPIVSEYIIQSISSIVVQKGDCVIDVGANHGIHTIPLSNIVGENGLVIACEAVPENIADIWLKLNGDDLLSGIRCPIQTGNVKFYQAAVTKQEVMENKKETCFHYIHGADGYSGIKKRPDIKDEYEDMLITVPALTLDWIIEDNDLEGRNLSFIKIDVEGGDFDVLLGARNILKKYRPIIVFENGRQFSANLYNYTKEDFFEYFTSLEYDLFQFTGNKFSRGEWEKEDVFWESWCIHAQSDWHDWFENNLTNFIDIFIKNYR